MLGFRPATLQCCCFYGNYFLFNKRRLKSVGLNPVLGRSICSFSRDSSVGVVCSWLSLLQGCGVSKRPSQHPLLIIPPHISAFWSSSGGSCQSRGQFAHVASYRDFCLPAESAPSGKIAPCLAKEVGESQTRLIHLQIMHWVAFLSFFPLFFSLN